MSKPSLQHLSLAHLQCQTASQYFQDLLASVKPPVPGRKFLPVLTTVMEGTTKPLSTSSLDGILHSANVAEKKILTYSQLFFAQCCKVGASLGWQPGVWSYSTNRQE